MSELNFFPKTSAHLYGKYYASIYESEIPHIVFGPAHFVAFELGRGPVWPEYFPQYLHFMNSCKIFCVNVMNP